MFNFINAICSTAVGFALVVMGVPTLLAFIITAAYKQMEKYQDRERAVRKMKVNSIRFHHGQPALK